jgi:hypothetical protein
VLGASCFVLCEKKTGDRGPETGKRGVFGAESLARVRDSCSWQKIVFVVRVRGQGTNDAGWFDWFIESIGGKARFVKSWVADSGYAE